MYCINALTVILSRVEADKQVKAKVDSDIRSPPMFTSSFLEEYYHPGAQPENAQAILAEPNG